MRMIRIVLALLFTALAAQTATDCQTATSLKTPASPTAVLISMATA